MAAASDGQQERARSKYGGWAEAKLTQPGGTRIIDEETYDIPGAKKCVGGARGVCCVCGECV
jgi:hypothetical protein